jgi:hypothetical protein
MLDKKEEQIVQKAREYAKEALVKYNGCCQGTFIGVCDALGLQYSSDTFKALVGLSGGVGRLSAGSCGAVCGGAAAIGLALGVEPEVLEKSLEKGEGRSEEQEEVYRIIIDFGRKFLEEYKGLSCRDVQFKLFGKSFDISNEKILEEFAKIRDEACPEAVADGAAWATEQILKHQKK